MEDLPEEWRPPQRFYQGGLGESQRGLGFWESPKKSKGAGRSASNFDPRAAQTRQTAPQAGPWVTEAARSSVSEEAPPHSIPPTDSFTNPQAPSTARLPRHRQSSTYIRPQAYAPRSGKVSREPIGAELGAWPRGRGRADGDSGAERTQRSRVRLATPGRSRTSDSSSGGRGRVRVALGGGGGRVLRERVERNAGTAGGGSVRPD